MNQQDSMLSNARDIVLHNWPSRDVPDTLVKTGFNVTVYGGPEPDDISVSELLDGTVISRRTGVPPERADIMYVYPWPGFSIDADLPKVARNASELGATTLWYQSGRKSDDSPDTRGHWLPEADAERMREIASSAGLTLIYDSYIADAARAARNVG